MEAILTHDSLLRKLKVRRPLWGHQACGLWLTPPVVLPWAPQKLRFALVALTRMRLKCDSNATPMRQMAYRGLFLHVLAGLGL